MPDLTGRPSAPASVVAVAREGVHRFSKAPQPSIRLLTGEGVAGDAHCGVTVKHRSRVAVDPTQPNLRQVHLIHAELLDELTLQGFALEPGDLGENILTRGIDLLGLSTGATLRIGSDATIMLTGLRNPCAQIETFRPGLLARVLSRAADGTFVRKSGVMGIVVQGGLVAPGDAIGVSAPDGSHRALERV